MAARDRSAGESRIPLPEVLVQERVIAILRAPDASAFVTVARCLVEEGIRCIEVTLTSAGALQAIDALCRDLGGQVCLGAGTVLTAQDAADAIDAGAAFIVSPGVITPVIDLAARRAVPSLPGAWSATEVINAWQSGATAVKLFPAATGGPDYLRHLRGPLPDVPLVPTGGVAIAAVKEYLDAGAVAVGVGAPLVGRGELAEPDLRSRARYLRAAIDSKAAG